MKAAMRKPYEYLIVPAVGVLIILALITGGGCAGGGTSGTGGGSFSVAGTLRTGANAPVAGVTVVAVPAPGAAGARITRAITEDVTDSQGQFALELDQRPDALTLRFNGDSFESDVAVTAIPATAVGITLDLSFDEETGEVNEEGEEFEESDEHSDSGESDQNSSSEDGSSDGSDETEVESEDGHSNSSSGDDRGSDESGSDESSSSSSGGDSSDD